MVSYHCATSAVLEEIKEDVILKTGIGEFKPPACLKRTSNSDSAMALFEIPVNFSVFHTETVITDESEITVESLTNKSTSVDKDVSQEIVVVIQSRNNLDVDMIPDLGLALIIYCPSITLYSTELEFAIHSIHEVVKNTKMKARFLDHNHHLFNLNTCNMKSAKSNQNTLVLPMESSYFYSSSIGVLYNITGENSNTVSGSKATNDTHSVSNSNVLFKVIRWRGLPTAHELTELMRQKMLVRYNGKIIAPKALLRTTHVYFNDKIKPVIPLGRDLKFSSSFSSIKAIGMKGAKTWEVINFDYKLELKAAKMTQPLVYDYEPKEVEVRAAHSSIIEGSTIAKLTPEYIDCYFRARHQIMQEAVAQALDVSFSNDVKFTEVFGLVPNVPGMANTPDIIIKKDNMNQEIWYELLDRVLDLGTHGEFDPLSITHLVSDISVSAKPTSAVIQKLAVYSDTVDKLNIHTNNEILLVPFIFSSNSKEVSLEGLWNEEQVHILKSALTRIHTYHDRIEKMDDYFMMANQVFSKEKVTSSLEDFDTLLSIQDVVSIHTAFDKVNLDFTHDDEDAMDDFTMTHEQCESHIKQLMIDINTIYEETTMKEVCSDQLFEKAKMKLYDGYQINDVKAAVVKHREFLENKNKEILDTSHKMPRFYKVPAMVSAPEGKELCRSDYDLEILKIFERHIIYEADVWENYVHIVNNMPKVEFMDEYVEESGEGFPVTMQTYNPAIHAMEEMFDTDINKSNSYKMMVSEVRDKITDTDLLTIFDKISELNVMKIAHWREQLSREIMYNSGRRMDTDVTKGLVRECDNYILMISTSKKFNREAPCKYKIIAPKSMIASSQNAMHSYYEVENSNDWLESKWLSYNYNDAETDCTLVGRLLSMLTHLISCRCDSDRRSIAELVNSHDFLTESHKTIIACMMESKRGTSVTNQLNRYIHHATLSHLSNKVGIIKQVGKTPIRSSMQSLVVHKQMLYCESNLTNFDSIQKRLVKEVYTDSDESSSDRHMIPSILGETLDQIEVAEMMNEAYAGNLFNINAGFVGHRSKEVMDKMAEDERMFREKYRDEPEEFKGNVTSTIEFFANSGNYGKFSKETMFTAGHVFKNRFMSSMDHSKLGSCLMESVMEMLSLKRLVLHTPGIQGDDNRGMGIEKKDYAYCAIRELVAETKCLSLSEMTNVIGTMRLYFATFPKNQHGVGREIQMQSMKSRPFFRLSENIWGYFCLSCPYEMISRGDQKFFIQANMKFKMTSLKSKGNWKHSMFVATNKDNSHWSPGWNMMSTIYFVKGLGLPKVMTNLLINHSKATMAKDIGLPTSLKEKWETKPGDRLETYSENLKWLEEEWKLRGASLPFLLGFVQGQNGNMSSVVHCGVWALIDEIMIREDNTSKFEIAQDTQLSSDDMTDYMTIWFNDSEGLTRALSYNHVVKMIVFTRANIHVNDKKTGTGFLVTEFNSSFMIGKRTLLPTIKDVYTVCSVPDYTIPEDAVKMVLSNEKRLLSSGASLWTHTMARIMNSRYLDEAYRTKSEVKDYMCSLLNISGNDHNKIPIQLGNLPTNDIYESLICGADYYMHKNLMSYTDADYYSTTSNLMKFYNNIYSSDATEIDQSMRLPTSIDSDVFGKIYAQLPTRSDTLLTELKNRYLVQSNTAVKIAEDTFHEKLVEPSTYDAFMESADSYLLGSGTFYEFRDTVCVNSLIRALGASSGKIKIVGAGKNVEEGQTYNMSSVAEIIVKIKGKKRSLSALPGADICTKVAIWSETKKPTKGKSAMDFEVYNHHKWRRVTFSTMNIVSNLSPLIIYKYMAGDASVSKKDTRNMIKSMSDHTGIDFTAGYDKVAKDMFPKSNTPRMLFWNFLGNYLKMSNIKSMNMAFEKPDSGSLFTNLANLYSRRTDPRGVLKTHKSLANSVSADQQSLDNITVLSTNINTMRNMSRMVMPQIEDTELPMTKESGNKDIYHKFLFSALTNPNSESVWKDLEGVVKYGKIKNYYRGKTVHVSMNHNEILMLFEEGYDTRSELLLTSDPDSSSYETLKSVLNVEYRTCNVLKSELGLVQAVNNNVVSVVVVSKDYPRCTKYNIKKSKEQVSVWATFAIIKPFPPLDIVLCRSSIIARPVPSKTIISSLDQETRLAMMSLFHPDDVDDHLVMQIISNKIEGNTFDCMSQLIYNPNTNISPKEALLMYKNEAEVLKIALDEEEETEADTIRKNAIAELSDEAKFIKNVESSLGEKSDYINISDAIGSKLVSEMFDSQILGGQNELLKPSLVSQELETETMPEELEFTKKNFPTLDASASLASGKKYKPNLENTTDLLTDFTSVENNSMLNTMLSSVNRMLSDDVIKAVDESNPESDANHSVRSLVARVAGSMRKDYVINTNDISAMYRAIYENTNDQLLSIMLLFHTLVEKISNEVKRVKKDKNVVIHDVTMLVLLSMKWLVPQSVLGVVWTKMEVMNVKLDVMPEESFKPVTAKFGKVRLVI
jgi:hypothetical protein